MSRGLFFAFFDSLGRWDGPEWSNLPPQTVTLFVPKIAPACYSVEPGVKCVRVSLEIIDFWASESLVQGPMDFFWSWVFPAVAVILFWVSKQATPGKNREPKPVTFSG